jgi:hypothetical protein
MVLYALLTNIVFNIVSFAARGATQDSFLASIAIVVIAIGIAIFTIISIFRLSCSVGTNPVVAAIIGVCMCIPCVSLILLLVVNQQATTLLQRHGVKVSLMGADPNSI